MTERQDPQATRAQGDADVERPAPRARDGGARAEGASDPDSPGAAAPADRGGSGSWGRGRNDRRRHAERARRIPIFRLLAYYVVITGVAAILVYYFPVVRTAFLAPLGDGAATGAQDFLNPEMSGVFQELAGNAERLLVTALVMVGTILLVLPVAWVYTFARRLRYDRSLVHSLILLAPVVAGTVMVVKTSLALAFSLAGIVAAVRFRTTVKDPKDAVHVFLVMAIGIAAGVQALDIALLLSLVFAVLVLIFWKYDIEVVADDDKELLSVGDTDLMLAQTPDGRERVQKRLEELAGEIKTDGILLIHTTQPDSARQVAEVVLSEVGKTWIFRDPPQGRNGVYTLEAVVRLRKKKTPVDLLGELEDRWSPTVAAAEYVPFHP